VKKAVTIVVASAVASCSFLARFDGSRAHWIVVSNQKDGTLSVLASDSGALPATVPVGDAPGALAARVTPPLVAVANSAAKRVTFVDPLQLAVVRTVALRDIPEFLAFSPDGTLLFATLPKSKSIAVIDADSGRLRDPLRVKQEPKRLAVSPDGHDLYVSQHARTGGVAVLDVRTGRLDGTLPSGAFPVDLALSRDGLHLLTANFDDDTITVIDTIGARKIATWRVDTGLGLLVHPTKPLAYSLASFDNDVVVLDYDTGEVITTLPSGEFPTRGAITPDGRSLYVVNQRSNDVVKVDTASNQVVRRFDVGSEPTDVVIIER